MSSSAKSRIAVIGLGSMGYGMASALKRAGFEVTGCDVAPETVQRFASEGGNGAKTPAEAAKEADIVVSVVVRVVIAFFAQAVVARQVMGSDDQVADPGVVGKGDREAR